MTEAKFTKVGKMIDKLQSISLSNPQEAFCIWNKSVKFKTTYIARTVENSEEYASPYDEALENFLSTILDRQLTDSIIQQASFPIRYGGLGLDVKSKDYFTIQYLNSKALTYNIVRNITHGEQIPDLKNSELRKNIMKSKKLFWTEKLDKLIDESSEDLKIRLQELKLTGANNWLNHIPVSFMLNRILPRKMFIDALLLRFNLKPSDMPLKCSAMKCQEDFTLNHADICPYGDFVIRRHDYVKMVLAQHAEKTYGACSVVVEPPLGKIEEGARDTLIGNLNDQARGDIIIRNFNGMQTTTYFDV